MPKPRVPKVRTTTKSATPKSATSKSTPATSATVPPTTAKALNGKSPHASLADQASDVAAAKTKTSTPTSKPAAKESPAPAAKAAARGERGKGGAKLEVPGSMDSSLRIFQIYYEAWQRDLLDPSFAAIDNSQLHSELEELLIVQRLAKSDYVKGAKLWGALSWRFAERTGMKSADWVAAIHANRGKDVYYCDPAPFNEALFHNLWMQGEMAHPNFLAVCTAFFKATKLPMEMLAAIVPGEHYASANYFVGTPKFWDLYLPWITELLKEANKNMPPKERDLMHAKASEGPHKGMSLTPFILERLFPIFVATVGKELSYQKIALPALDAQLNVHLRLLREAKNLAHSTKSPWLAALWVNYRNLYLIQTNGKDWAAKNLRRITPTEIHFA